MSCLLSTIIRGFRCDKATGTYSHPLFLRDKPLLCRAMKGEWKMKYKEQKKNSKNIKQKLPAKKRLLSKLARATVEDPNENDHDDDDHSSISTISNIGIVIEDTNAHSLSSSLQVTNSSSNNNTERMVQEQQQQIQLQHNLLLLRENYMKALIDGRGKANKRK